MVQEDGNEDLTPKKVGKMLDMDFINELTGKMGKAMVDGFGEKIYYRNIHLIAGVPGLQDLPLFFVAGMEVDLGGEDAAVTQELLDVLDISSLLQQKGGKGVTEGVGGDVASESGLLHVIPDTVPNSVGL